MKNKFYVTTPIYYINDLPHIGHAYTTIAADALARHWRQKIGNDNVFFMTGTDEHGAKIQESAEKAGQTPIKFADEVVSKYKKSWEKLNISYDHFLRTTDKKHEEAVQWVVNKLYNQGDIYKGAYQALYCVGCEQYKTKSELLEGNVCPEHNRPCEIHDEEAYLFKLSKFQKEIKKKIEKDEIKIRPVTRKNEILSFIKSEGLRDVAVSRKKETVSWGIDLPFDKNHTIYVWVDAFLNYLTGLGWPKNKKQADIFWPADVQLMAKDIMRVHATIWQAMLLALGLSSSKELFIHGYFTVNGKKMSKSLGNSLDPVLLAEKFGSDTIRYAVLREFPFGQDGDISEDKIAQRYQSDLGNQLGNLVQRTLTMINKYQVDVKTTKPLSIVEDALIENLQFETYLAHIWRDIKNANVYIDNSKPWELSKNDPEKLKAVLNEVFSKLIAVTEAISPIMPDTAEKMRLQLKSKKPEPLFPRLEDAS